MINEEYKIKLTAQQSKDDIPKILDKKPPGKYCVFQGKKCIKVITHTGDESPVDQSPQVDTDINKLLEPAIARGLLRHATEFEGEYDDFAATDFQEAQFMVAKATSSFEKLPAKIRNQFDNNPAEFIKYTNDPANAQQLQKWGVLKGNDGLRSDGTPSGAPTKTDKDGDGVPDPVPPKQSPDPA